jgi:hypothetical protein
MRGRHRATADLGDLGDLGDMGGQGVRGLWRRHPSAGEDPVVEEAIGILMHRLNVSHRQASAIFEASVAVANIGPGEFARILAGAIEDKLLAVSRSLPPAQRLGAGAQPAR